jgi:biopolymer transport protein ExbB
MGRTKVGKSLIGGFHMLEFFLKGGPLMWPILICSIIMVAIVIERLVVFNAKGKDTDHVIKEDKSLVLKKKYSKAAELCDGSGSPVTAVLAASIRVSKVKNVDKEGIIQSVGSKEIRKLDKNLRGLAIIANISPLIGLLGTVTGLIKSFIQIQELGGRVDASILAGGIWEALITTAAGLSVAIVSVVFYHYFEGRVDSISSKMKESVQYINEWLRVGELKISKKEAEIVEDIDYGI